MTVEKFVPGEVVDRLPTRSERLGRIAAEMDPIVHLGYGDVGFVTPDHIREAAKLAIKHGHTRYENVTELHEAIAEKLARDNGIEVNPATEVLVADGCKAVCSLLIQTFVSPGDEVILFSPGSYNYDNTRFQGGVPVEVELRSSRGFRINADELAEAITPKTKIISLTTPDAPTGTVHPRENLEQVAELAQEHDLLVISDEIYEKINYGSTPHFSIGSLPGMHQRTITVNGFSKGYAMTGWRVGYAAGPENVLNIVKRVNALSTIWLNAVAQYAALAAYEGPQEAVTLMVQEYKRRMMVLHAGINEIEGLEMRFPDGTYYGWVDLAPLGLKSDVFAEHLLLTEQVQVNPGLSSFGTKGGDARVRVSCSAPESELREGLTRLDRAVQRLKDRGPTLWERGR